MCGLVYQMGRQSGDVETRLKRMEAALDTIRHRGLPGRRGYMLNDVVCGGHVRLPIRGLGGEYDQPMQCAEWSGMFVGEVFDTPEGVVNDSQYALDLLHTEGPKGLTQHDGFWSIVRYDNRSGRTTVVTDHLAIKPLYWNKRDKVIASEMRAVVSLSGPMSVNFHNISNIRKWGYDPTGQTQYKEIVRLEPGSFYVFDHLGDLIKQERYFDLTPKEGDLREALERATKNRLHSDIPVSSLCSGGLDSTIVSLLAAQHQPLTVFHIENDEARYFDMIDWPSTVEVFHMAIDTMELDDALRATEEPVDLGSVLPQYQLGRAIQEAGFNVVLSGDGADELFGGYRRAKDYDSQYSDIFSELVHYHNPRLDKCMMASTVELRSPFLAPDVIRIALGLPYEERTSKQALKEAFSDIVPPEILQREKRPLRTSAVNLGGQVYREKIIQVFLDRV